MKKAVIALLFVGGVAVAASPVTFLRWQDMATYVGQLTTRVNEHTADIAALEAEVATLKATQDLMWKDQQNTMVAYDVLLRAINVQVCNYNSKVDGWKGILLGLEKIPMNADATCFPAGTRYYNPIFLSPDGPPVPPAP